jgi:tetratricopeptide (TPR) repeat protein
MALNRSAINTIFACIVLLLGLTAAFSIHARFSKPGIQVQNRAAGGPTDDIETKVAALQQLISRDPQNPEYQVEIANIYYDSGRYDKAADFYLKALNLSPNNPNVETDLATCYHYLGQDDLALEILDKVLKYSPGFPQAMFNKGIVLINGKKDVEQRIAQLKASFK